MTGDRTGAAAAVARRVSSSKRLNLARRIVQWSMGTFPGFFVTFTLVGMYNEPPSHAAELMPLAMRLDGTAGSLAVGTLLAATAAVGYLIWRVICHRIDRTEKHLHRDIAVSVAAVTAVVVLMQPAPIITALTVLWASCLTIAVSRRTSALLLAYALVLGFAPIAVAVGYNGSLIGTLAMLGAVLIMIVVWAFFCASAFSLVVLWEILNEAYEARDAQARLAVTEERLRFSRDLHDLIGHSLSGIAVKSELAARLAERDPGHAADEMRAVQRLARDALREVRTAVSGYRDVDLDAEIESVRAVFTAAGVRCTLAEAAAVPDPLRPLAAWVVREAATNVLRHSTAKRCDITLHSEGRTVIVEVFNDGSPEGAGQAPFGNGLTGLTERTAAVGGTISASATAGDGFLLRAVLPVPADAGGGPRRAEGPVGSGAMRDVTA
ncbi:two-component system sensor histidine kinase DesK [Murinocardiopsis flavida]|uniref:Two-component system sensor histidine kinase DesK n=2 Tax=Murinocardiopsis flavida TaxID=645275 RepID=A0A2P8DN06_9ACTN|nr:two-component system sensor histidine kinase DesK [Murinocardiopsis flavida]